MALGIDSLGIQSLKALATQLGVAGKRPLNREKPSALAEEVFTCRSLQMKESSCLIGNWDQNRLHAFQVFSDSPRRAFLTVLVGAFPCRAL